MRGKGCGGSECNSKGETVPEYGRNCFRKELRVSNGPFGSRQAVRASSEHKTATIFKMESIGCYGTLKFTVVALSDPTGRACHRT